MDHALTAVLQRAFGHDMARPGLNRRIVRRGSCPEGVINLDRVPHAGDTTPDRVPELHLGELMLHGPDDVEHLLCKGRCQGH